MGDFAAGKTFAAGEGAQLAPVTPADFDQFVTDMEGSPGFAEAVAGIAAVPVEMPAGFCLPGTPGELLLCLKQWRDTDLQIFVAGTSFIIDAADTILAQDPPQDPTVAFLIGADLDGEGLYTTLDGMLHTGSPEALNPVGMDLGQVLSMWRNDVITKRIMWAEGWIESA